MICCLMRLSAFHYDLPDELIARYPLPERSGSRLLRLAGGEIEHHPFRAILNWLNPGDLLICNNSKVIPARLRGVKTTGGQVEVLIERILDHHRILAQLRVSKKPRPGDRLILSQVPFEVLGRNREFFELRCEEDRNILEVIESIGEIPLPPYLARLPDVSDRERYQTIYAHPKGSAAAPTAGLHFDHALFSALRAKQVDIDFVTLHVGAGTFSPVRVEDITQHIMHSEYIMVSAEVCEKITKARARGSKVIAVGTTTARSLETASLSGTLKPYAGETRLFIYPGFEFRCIDALITNFHLPCSSLMMLVAAFGGYEAVMNAYRVAVRQRYRFFSYGDAMWVSRLMP